MMCLESPPAFQNLVRPISLRLNQQVYELQSIIIIHRFPSVDLFIHKLGFCWDKSIYVRGHSVVTSGHYHELGILSGSDLRVE
jgi:hypothetical protein